MNTTRYAIDGLDDQIIVRQLTYNQPAQSQSVQWSGWFNSQHACRTTIRHNE